MFLLSLHSMSGIRSANDEDIPEFTWTLEDGYKQPVVDPDIYPINSLGGILGKPFMFIFSVLKDDLTAECENFQGFKVNFKSEFFFVFLTKKLPRRKRFFF